MLGGADAEADAQRQVGMSAQAGNGLLDVVEIRKDDRKMNQQWKKLVNGQLAPGQQARKSLIAMPSAKRLIFPRRR